MKTIDLITIPDDYKHVKLNLKEIENRYIAPRAYSGLLIEAEIAEPGAIPSDYTYRWVVEYFVKGNTQATEVAWINGVSADGSIYKTDGHRLRLLPGTF